MRVFRSFDEAPSLRAPVVAVGSFDGVHLGHRALLEMTMRLARERGGESVAVTFDPHPRRVTGGEVPGELTSVEEKALLLGELGVDNLLVAPFTKEFSRLPPEEFVRDCLVGRLGMRALAMGYNHHFGRDKEGGLELLRRLQGQSGFELHELPRQEVGCHKVSSTVIRGLIACGDMAGAAQLLGRPYFMLARIEKERLLPLSPYKLVPQEGSYPVEVDGVRNRLIVGAKGRLTLESARSVYEKVLITFG
ncbi:MAG: adenylyltransferase/cytidyltransferase family protein [Rikenellaceae bacterium]|jgi:riboflavin kinase/FMN adenylyltransferase|nr:adenylyltransferase/cytidyltransferase family protein [Rikenellaceae bacterium]